VTSSIVDGARLELARLLTRRGWWWAGAAAVALAAAAAGARATHGSGPVPAVDAVRAVPATTAASILGVLLVANDIRHGTLARFLLLVGNRTELLAAKVLAAAGAATMLAATAVVVGRAVAALAGADAGSPAEEVEAVTAVVVASVASSLLGLAVAVLVRGTALPFVLVLAAAPLVDATVAAGEPGLARWLPFTLVHSVATGSRQLEASTPPTTAADVVALGLWVAALVAAAADRFARRDVLSTRPS
jgi:hypothetical protein